VRLGASPRLVRVVDDEYAALLVRRADVFPAHANVEVVVALRDRRAVGELKAHHRPKICPGEEHAHVSHSVTYFLSKPTVSAAHGRVWHAADVTPRSR